MVFVHTLPEKNVSYESEANAMTDSSGETRAGDAIGYEELRHASCYELGHQAREVSCRGTMWEKTVRQGTRGLKGKKNTAHEVKFGEKVHYRFTRREKLG